MTMAADLFQHFQTMWQAGTNARLSLECHAGEVWMNFQVHLSHPPPPPPLRPPPPFQYQQPRKSPSRLRRHARRAEARAKAAVNIKSGATTDAAVQTDPVKDLNNPSPVSFSGDSDELPHQYHHQEAGTPRPSDAACRQQHQAAHTQLESLSSRNIPDVFCPDSEYQQSVSAVLQPPLHEDLPQLDGHATDNEDEQQDLEGDWINPNPATGRWICRCCYFAHSFKTEEDLKEHHDTLSMEYDECNVCYPWHVWT